uniref:NMDA receptor synaptonuclear signaling and neuronal migration factor a n=1 Tax=Oncorhynchus tshawytscha TaxID=74940 RepID=A0A8C8IVB5_ONCTS
MGTVVSKRKNLRNDAISSVAAKVRGSPALPESSLVKSPLGHLQPPPPSITTTKTRLSLERSFSAEEDQQKCVECALQPARVYTITGEHSMLGSNRGSKESLELEVLKGASTLVQPSTSPSSTSSPTHHRHGNPVAGSSNSNHHTLAQPLSSSVSAHNIRSWGEGGKGGSREDCSLNMALDSSGAPSRSQGSLDLESSREAGKQHRLLERMWSVDRMTGLEREDNNWYPKENMFSFQTASTTMQANFRKHLRMVGSRRMKAQTFAERRAKSFNRSWSDPTPVKNDSSHDTRDSGDLPASCGTLDEGEREDLDWEEEREMERLACEGDDFIPPKIMLISSKVPKAEYVPTIIRRDDPSIIPILYDHEHATFDDILEEIDKKLTTYRRGSRIWRMLIFCQGGPGHLYLLKNKVATFAKVEKEEDMSQFWRRLSRFMSKVNPEPNLIHIMGCYVLGNPNGEKLFQKLKNLMRPYSIQFESPLELSAQGKEIIEMYFDFRLFRLWKTRQHSKLLDYEDLL